MRSSTSPKGWCKELWLRWSRRCLLVCVPGFVAAVASCAISQQTEDPFLIPEVSFLDSVQKVVLAPTRVVGAVYLGDERLTAIDQLLAEKLFGVGYDVVPAVEYARIWQQISRFSGGFYDPFTGELDEDKYRAATDRLFAELAGRFKPDALFYPEIWEVRVPFSYGEARWAGAVEEVMGGVGYSGEINASLLMLVVQDTTGRELYVREAGIELLEYMDEGEFTPMPPGLSFNDSSLITRAVDSVLAPILDARRDTSTTAENPNRTPDTMLISVSQLQHQLGRTRFNQ